MARLDAYPANVDGPLDLGQALFMLVGYSRPGPIHVGGYPWSDPVMLAWGTRPNPKPTHLLMWPPETSWDNRSFDNWRWYLMAPISRPEYAALTDALPGKTAVAGMSAVKCRLRTHLGVQ